MQILRGLTGGSAASAGLGTLQIAAAAMVLRLVLALQLTSIDLGEDEPWVTGRRHILCTTTSRSWPELARTIGPVLKSPCK
jgi:hypothetical protein